MSRKYRISLLVISLIMITCIGWYFTKGFDFLLNDYWFVSGILLVILLSLIDQPFFSTEANVFVNSVTAFLSLVLVQKADRSATWLTFLIITIFLISISYGLMWLRKNPLFKEPKVIKIFAFMVSRIGRPEVLFSILFIWGIIRKFGINSVETNAFLLFWGIFIILNIPAFAKKFSENKLFYDLLKDDEGVVTGMINPSIVTVQLKNDLRFNIGDIYDLFVKSDLIASGILIDDRLIKDKRIGKISLFEKNNSFYKISSESNTPVVINKSASTLQELNEGVPISIVDKNTKLGNLSFYINPDRNMSEGEIVWVNIEDSFKGFYQVISATLTKDSEDQSNMLFSIHVIAGQLGKWNSDECRFEPINWVPQAGTVIYKATDSTISEPNIPEGHLLVGNVPNSKFPVHVNIQDTVTHNTAIIGVTGSGKSYLAFHIIEELAKNNIKILILDLSRQHWIYLDKHNTVTPIQTFEKIDKWYNSTDSFIGIYQFADEEHSYPKATADFVKKIYELASTVKLKAGENEPAKVCVVFEEAHSLIPEWNQVSQKNDSDHVNKTARFLLQGRKYGMGCLIITQRTANVTKTILNQCNSIFALQSFDQTGLDFISNYMGSEYSDTITTLPKQHSILVGKSSSSAHPILFRLLDLSERYKSDDET
ncbi:MAG: ATP-binding protein [Calditrichaceae bacterium]